MKTDGLLGSAAGADSAAPTSTPSGERVFKVSRWSARPTAYFVVSRTAKTMKVVEEHRNGYRSSYQNLVRSSDLGREWFISERDAWLAILTRCQRQVEADKAALQRSRTDLGMVRATLAREGIDVAQDADQPDAALPSKEKEPQTL
jgi:hypothetical protein